MADSDQPVSCSISVCKLASTTRCASTAALFVSPPATHLSTAAFPGFNTFLAVLATSMPINIFAQNNGIISFTLCASRVAGVFAGAWLILFGVIGKVCTPYQPVLQLMAGQSSSCSGSQHHTQIEMAGTLV